MATCMATNRASVLRTCYDWQTPPSPSHSQVSRKGYELASTADGLCDRVEGCLRTERCKPSERLLYACTWSFFKWAPTNLLYELSVPHKEEPQREGRRPRHHVTLCQAPGSEQLQRLTLLLCKPTGTHLSLAGIVERRRVAKNRPCLEKGALDSCVKADTKHTARASADQYREARFRRQNPLRPCCPRGLRAF